MTSSRCPSGWYHQPRHGRVIWFFVNRQHIEECSLNYNPLNFIEASQHIHKKQRQHHKNCMSFYGNVYWAMKWRENIVFNDDTCRSGGKTWQFTKERSVWRFFHWSLNQIRSLSAGFMLKISFFPRQIEWNTANIILIKQNKNICSGTNQFLKDPFHFSNGCASRKLIIFLSSADGDTSNLNLVFCCISVRFPRQFQRKLVSEQSYVNSYHTGPHMSCVTFWLFLQSNVRRKQSVWLAD